MQPIRVCRIVLSLSVVVSGAASAQAPAASDATVRELQQELARLRGELDSLRADYAARLAALESRLGSAPAPVPAPAPAPPPAEAAVPAGVAGSVGPSASL